jgi:hypothetical protein
VGGATGDELLAFRIEIAELFEDACTVWKSAQISKIFELEATFSGARAEWSKPEFDEEELGGTV